MLINRNNDEKIKLNRKNYKFTEEQYKLLSDKEPRNLVEHLDERNEKEIEVFKSVGGFNVLLDNEQVVDSIGEKPELYPYTLDLRNSSLILYNIKHQENPQCIIYLAQLESEMKTLKKSVDCFMSILKMFK